MIIKYIDNKIILAYSVIKRKQQRITAMNLFLRFTETPEEDMNRNTSIHITDASSIDEAVEMYGGEAEDYVITEMGVGQIIDGLCGFILDAENLEDALKEIDERYSNPMSQYNTVSNPSFAIYEGEYADGDVPDGTAFYAQKIIYNRG